MNPGDYAAVAVGRAKEVRQRIGFAVFIATAAWVFTRGWEPFAWFAAVVVMQMVDRWICLPVRDYTDREPPTSLKATLAISMATSALLFSSISVHIWADGGVAGKAFAILLPAGAVLAMAVRTGSARHLLVSSWAPHALYLVGLPLISSLFTPQADYLEMGMLSLGGVLFLTHVLVAVVHIQRTAEALRAALHEADALRLRAEQASAAKSDFLATMSHEIRTPMNAVVAAAQLLRRTPLRHDQNEYVDILSNAAEVMMGLLNDVLDIAKIEAGKIVMESATFDLRQKLELGAHLWRPRAAQRGVALEYDFGDLPERIVTDPLRLQQILFNLLSNAVKFTEMGRIDIRGGRSPSGKTVWFEVSDTGCGMDEETASRVFGRFEQASSKTARLYGGTGLGLTISRRLAELLGGSLGVVSEQGKGSTFRLEIPLVAAEATTAVAPVIQKVAACADGADVLLAEDHAVNQKIVRLILEPLGYRITVVADGAQAVEAATERVFDVILMDMQMPVLDGIEATLRIRASNGPNARTPVVALTANALAEHQAQWAAAGVNRFIAKPVDMVALIQQVADAVAEGRAEVRDNDVRTATCG
jgi:signal transduction histidine kinase/AmiR/NasT family two-component response regulator